MGNLLNCPKCKCVCFTGELEVFAEYDIKFTAVDKKVKAVKGDKSPKTERRMGAVRCIECRYVFGNDSKAYLAAQKLFCSGNKSQKTKKVKGGGQTVDDQESS